MSDQLFSSLIQLCVGMAGGLLVLASIWYKERLETASKSKFTRYQLAAEIRALLDVIQVNDLVRKSEEHAKKLESGGKDIFRFTTNRNFTPVFDGNLQNLGLLEECAADVVRFYLVLRSAMEESDNLHLLKEEIMRREEANLPLRKANYAFLLECQQTLTLKLVEAVALGEKMYWELMRQVPPKKKALVAKAADPMRGFIAERNRDLEP